MKESKLPQYFNFLKKIKVTLNVPSLKFLQSIKTSVDRIGHPDTVRAFVMSDITESILIGCGTATGHLVYVYKIYLVHSRFFKGQSDGQLKSYPF